mmetsp:Transcript_32317/g.64013  ORF Transcript_32317/g.64013 Transcript_32317/m.64013 type:complete len:155 (+) Transcript_32317:1427-1891(+)
MRCGPDGIDSPLLLLVNTAAGTSSRMSSPRPRHRSVGELRRRRRVCDPEAGEAEAGKRTRTCWRLRRFLTTARGETEALAIFITGELFLSALRLVLMRGRRWEVPLGKGEAVAEVGDEGEDDVTSGENATPEQERGAGPGESLLTPPPPGVTNS